MTNLSKLWPETLIFGVQVRIRNISVKFICQDNRVKVKVTGYYRTTTVAYPDK